ncbi:MAG: hypothetical protein ACOC5R_02440 [Elusimicrobiota bacterium]
MKKLSLLILILLITRLPVFAQPEPIKNSKFICNLNSEEEENKSIFSVLSFNIIKTQSFQNSFDVSINYLDYYFVTPDNLAGYYIGLPMKCEVVIKNTGDKDFAGLTVTMVHEYYESGVCDRYWSPPSPVEFLKGEQLPGESAKVWPDIDIKKGQTIRLPFSYTSPMETCSGLDQTHVIIHSKDDEDILELYNNSEAGVFCPPPPE